MKTFRFVYWFGSCITECYVKADSLDEAKKKFVEQKGDRFVISIEHCQIEVLQTERK